MQCAVNGVHFTVCSVQCKLQSDVFTRVGQETFLTMTTPKLTGAVDPFISDDDAIINRPGLAGAVLQTPLPFSD